jgi:hypothetical protein
MQKKNKDMFMCHLRIQVKIIIYRQREAGSKQKRQLTFKQTTQHYIPDDRMIRF